MIKNEYFNTPNWTGRTPRTMEEAFGCGSHYFETAPDMGSKKQFIIYLVVLAVAISGFLIQSGVIKLW